MRTRCPDCGTVFRVTSEQLRRKAGKVRCGHCQSVFNAFDQWLSDSDEPEVNAPTPELAASPVEQLQTEPEAALEELAVEPEPELAEPVDTLVEEPFEEVIEVLPLESIDSDVPAELGAPTVPGDSEPESVPGSELQAPCDDASPDESQETPEESTQAARDAGLVAARELNDTTAYNRWAAGTLTSDGLGGFASESAKRAVWPFVLASILLIVALLGQLLYYFRSEIVLRMPSTASLYQLVSVDIPLPRNPALVSIETSDLQSDNARGLFVLQATLKNRADYAQAWPALELSLTDTNDSVVSRRVMFAAEYLPPGTASDHFPANGEVAVRLWIEAKEIGASGYRLYIFYP